MDRARFQAVRELYLRVRDQPPAEWRRAVEAASDDEEVRREVMELLEQECGEFLEQGVRARPFLEALEERPKDIGEFSITGVLGGGGMGIVYAARQKSPSREVAIKVLRAEMLSDRSRRRFEEEAEILARLSHEGIAKVYGAGCAPTSEGPRPYFAMELVRGEPIDEYARAHGLSVEQKVQLLIRVCEGVEHAHQHGVIHRDLKPANILVDERGQPRILDFGIARAVGDRSATLATEPGRLLGTLAYMSPEQLEGKSAFLDTRTDIYSLGVVAYELFVGESPYGEEKSLAGLLRSIREAEPRPMGSAIGNSDLKIIVGKALQKARDQRYSSVSDLAADLRRWLAREPISARPPSAMYTIRMFARRHTMLAAVSGAAVVVLMVGVAVTALLIGRTMQAEDAARRRAIEGMEAREHLQAASEFQVSLVGKIDLRTLGETSRASIARQLEHLDNGGQAAEVLARLDMEHVTRDVLRHSVLATAGASIDYEYSESPAVRASLHQILGETCRKLGLLQESLYHTSQALELRRQTLGPRHADTLWSTACMGLTFAALRKHQEAEAMVRQAVEGMKAEFGSGHAETLIAMGELGHLLAQAGRSGEGELLLRESAEGLRKTLGEENRHVAGAARRLAQVLRQEGRSLEAMEHARVALACMVSVDGEEHWRACRERAMVASLLMDVGRLDEAEGMARRSLEAVRGAMGGPAAERVRAEAVMARVLAMKGEVAEAQRHYREAIQAGVGRPEVDDGLKEAVRDAQRAIELRGDIGGM